MNLKQQNVLFFSRTMGMGGTSNVMIQMCKILKPKVNKMVVCSTGGPMVKTLEEMGILHIQINDVGKHDPATFIKVINQISKIIKNEEITVVHTHHRMAAFYAAVIKKRHNFILINTSHNTFYNNKRITQFAYRNAKLIACGEMVKKNLVDYFDFNASQVTVIHNAIEKFDDEVVVDKTLKKLKEDGFYLVGNVGRFAEQKGMEYFIKSYPMIKKKTDRIKYILIGDGVDREKLKSLVNQLGIQEEVIFLGFRRDVQNVLSQVDLLVLSSLWEGLPLTPIEGFSVGKTVVATAVDGTVEVVDDSKNGYLIPAKNSEKIAEKVLYLFEHPETQKQLEREAYRTFQNEFSFEKFSEKVLNYYEKC